jgi:hypothetical protein
MQTPGSAPSLVTHSASALQARHAFASQIGVVPLQSLSMRQPTHVLVLVSQTAVGAAQSVDCKHCTHRPASLSHTGAFGFMQVAAVQPGAVSTPLSGLGETHRCQTPAVSSWLHTRPFGQSLFCWHLPGLS